MIEFIFSGSAKINECGKKLFKRKNVRVLLTSCAILVNQLQSKRPNAVKQKYFIFILFVGSNTSRVYKMLPSFYNCCYLSWFTVIFCCQYQFRAIKKLTTFYCFYLFISQPVFLCLIFNSKSLSVRTISTIWDFFLTILNSCHMIRIMITVVLLTTYLNLVARKKLGNRLVECKWCLKIQL